MALSPSQVLLYVADESDYEIAMGAAAGAGISLDNVVGNFSTIWSDVQSGNYLVIAVGGFANTALYYNPCGWSNPSGDAGGSTPFAYASTTNSSTDTSPIDTLPGANYFVNGAGQTGEDTLKLATMLAYYAVNGNYPSNYGSTLPLPLQHPPHVTTT